MNMYQKKKIRTWKQFAKHVRPRGCRLLKNLDQFQNSILVTGCQRSGTTILSRVITLSEGMVNYWFGKDDELDAALILSGDVEVSNEGRHCFQTTYLNECYKEYFDYNGSYRMIWVLRNPFSVIYSLMYNWRRWTLNELFKGCGAGLLDPEMEVGYKRYGLFGVSRLIKACLSYNGKISQLFELIEKLEKDSIMVVEYDKVVEDREKQLKEIYGFLELPYKNRYGALIHQKSIKKREGLSKKELEIVQDICLPIYENAKHFLNRDFFRLQN
jgi:hypothetical protein